jgi:hypothetical protein
MKRKSCALTRSSRMVAFISQRSHHGPAAARLPVRRTRANTSRPISFVRVSRLAAAVPATSQSYAQAAAITGRAHKPITRPHRLLVPQMPARRHSS